MRIYFAHPINSYGQDVERRCLAVLHKRFAGCEIVNPNLPEHERGYREAQTVSQSGSGLAYYTEQVIPTCRALAFLAFPDGLVSSGCATEIECAWHLMLPIYEIDVAGDRLIAELTEDGVAGVLRRAMTRAETKLRVRFPDSTPRGWS